MKRALLQKSGAWLPQFGEFDLSAPDIITVTSGAPVHGLFHAEAHHDRVLGSDFVYSATITADWSQPDLSAHIQFRISDEGRYGVRMQAGKVIPYLFMLPDRPCNNDTSVIAHCPLWPESGDDPIEFPLTPVGAFDTALRTLKITVSAEGERFIISFGSPSRELSRLEVQDGNLGIGRFGIYVLAAQQNLQQRGQVQFSEVAATADPTASSNFALLYSTPGYDRDGTKRALVRTVNDVDAQDYDGANSTFTIKNSSGGVVIRDRRFEASGRLGKETSFRQTLGFQFLAADFTDLREAGHYTLEARLATSEGNRLLRSGAFEIAPRFVTERMLWPLSILNAKARRAADEDFRRNWFIESGHTAWSVGLDGAFIADRADDQRGAVLRRIFNAAGNVPLSPDAAAVVNFRMVARITIIAGCDAQLQFRITADERWAVTLQAGDAGGCQHGAGPGAVRLHREGIAVANEDHFQAVRSHRMDNKPFETGHAYDVEVRAQDKQIEVWLDGERVIDFAEAANPRAGTFALKAWASTVRFGHFKVWARNVGLSRPVPGVWIPYNRLTRQSSQGFEITKLDIEDNHIKPDSDDDLMYPVAAQQHGFHDCSSFIGEVTSHSVFLSSLMNVWSTRAHEVSQERQEDLRQAILTTVLYLNELYEQGNRSGAFAHQEPGRAAFNPATNKRENTQFAMYGLSAFAEMGHSVDKKLAHTAFNMVSEAWCWLDQNGERDPSLDCVVAIRMTRAARREGLPAGHWLERARSNAEKVLAAFEMSGAMAKMLRTTLRSIPWFEGIYEAYFHGPLELNRMQQDQLKSIADQLLALMNDPANGFCLMPQADDDRDPIDPGLPERNWKNLADLPLVGKSIPKPPFEPVGDWYVCEHFATAAADCVYIGRLAGQKPLERLATGNLYWSLGLNPGIPTTKVVRPELTGGPWSAASFVYNGPGSFGRLIEGNRTRTNAAKGWLADWEQPASSRHREIWAIDPLRNGFQSIVNGHVLREHQWHYWSVGTAGWVSAETFLLIDASFIKASLALEDWHSESTLVRDTPYDVSKFHFFDTTHLDRASTLWRFDDPDRASAAMASRMATDFAGTKGFGAGRPTGHHIGERVGVLCFPVQSTTFVDVPLSEIAQTHFPFVDIDAASWAQVARAATEIAAKRQAGAGFFTGHQVSKRFGWFGLDSSFVEVFDVDDETIGKSEWAFTDINSVSWAQAARVATDICINAGFVGGFFTGHQLPNKRQIAALRRT